MRRFGNQVFYGDASRLELLRAAHAENAEVFVLAIDDVEASVKTAELIRQYFPHLKIFARARNRQHAFRLMDLDVRYIIRETLVSSLEMSVQVLEALGLSKSKAVETVHQFRVHDEATMAKQQAVKDDEKKFLADHPRIRRAAAAPVRGRQRAAGGIDTTCSEFVVQPWQGRSGHTTSSLKIAVAERTSEGSATPSCRSSRSWSARADRHCA